MLLKRKIIKSQRPSASKKTNHNKSKKYHLSIINSILKKYPLIMKKGIYYLITISSLFWTPLLAQNNSIINQKDANQKEAIAVRLLEEENLDQAIQVYKELIPYYQKQNKWNQWLQSYINLTKAIRLNEDYLLAQKVMGNCLQTDFFTPIDDVILKAEVFHQHGVTLYQLDLYQKLKTIFY